MDPDRLLSGLGRTVRERRTGRGLTLRDLAERSALSVRFLAQVESGQGNISVRKLASLARALGTTPSELLSGPGGEALLRLEIAKALAARRPKFVLMNSAGGKSGVDLNRVDTNELIRQAGIFAAVYEGTSDEKKAARPPAEGKEGEAERTPPAPEQVSSAPEISQPPRVAEPLSDAAVVLACAPP